MHAGIGWAEHAGGAVLPNPGVDHPLRKRVEAPSLRNAVSFGQVAFDAPVGKNA